MAGKGKYEDEVKALVNDLDLSDRVTFIGVREEVAVPFLISDIFVFPAIEREGFGIVVLEAMALQRPIVVSDIEAVNRIVKNHESGLLAEVGNAEDLAEKIDFLLSNEIERQQFVQNAFHDVKDRFSLEKMSNRIYQVYENCLRVV